LTRKGLCDTIHILFQTIDSLIFITPAYQKASLFVTGVAF